MMFSASRSRRLQIVPIIQSFSQLEKNYGKEGAELFFKWGIQFEEEYTVAEHGNRRVAYAEKQEIIDGIRNKYQPAWMEEICNTRLKKGGIIKIPLITKGKLCPLGDRWYWSQ